MNEPRAPWLAGLAFVLGAVGLTLAAVQEAAGPFVRPRPLEEVFQEKAKSYYERALDALRGTPAEARRPPPEPPREMDRIARGTTAGLGALAVALALAGYARRESLRVSATAAILGIVALPWQLGLGVVVAMVFVAATSSAVTRAQGPPPGPGAG